MEIIDIKMKDIAIYGAGGFGREIACLLKSINETESTWNFIGFFDDGKDIGSSNEYGRILGGINELNAIKEPLAVILAIGSPKIVETIVGNITSSFVNFPNIVSPDTMLLDKDNISFGKGNVICSGCLFSCNIQIGDFNTFNGFISVGHDACIGNFNSFMPAVRISGEVIIGTRNFFGVASVVLQQVKIGCDTVIGANSTIIRKTKDENTYVGNPASIVKY